MTVINYDFKNPSEEIRKELDRLCDSKAHPFNNPDKYYQVFFPKFSPSLKVISAPSPEKKFNCYAYALGIDEWVYKSTITGAIKGNILIENSSPKAGDIVLYSAPGDHFAHAGILVNTTKVKSKWASGPIFEHDFFFAPFSYGNKVGFYNPIDEKTRSEISAKNKILNP